MTATLFDFPSSAPVAKLKKIKEGYTGEFLAFWELYPPRFNSSKFLAFKAWKKLDADEQRQATAAAPVYAARQKNKDEQFTQHAATWLNGKYFEMISASCMVSAAPVIVNWQAVLKIYHATGRWNSDLGPEPGMPGYLGPK